MKQFKYNELTNSQIQNIINDFQDLTIPTKNILKIHNISDRTLYRILKNYNIQKRNKVIDKETYKQAVEYYMSGQKLEDTCQKFNISQTSLYKYMHKNNIVHYTNKGRKRFFNKSYFKTIDTQNKAYWFGFLYADGSLNKSNKYDKEPNRLKINISNQDIEILENFLIDIESQDINIKTYTPNESTYATSLMSEITLNSTEICEDMLRNGFRKKSILANEDVFNFIPQNLTHHFIRGYFDGDGSININKDITFSGAIKFLEKIDSILKENEIISLSNIYTYNDHRKDKSYILKISTRNNQTQKMFNYMYKNANRFLKRKYNRF